MTDRELDNALDELYAVDPSEFVTERKRLAASLRDAGRKEDAALVRAARRPSTSAWALNQLARREPERIEQLLERSGALQSAQDRAIAGERDAMREATAAHREALEAATQAAFAVLGPRANDGFRSEIVASLRAASTDDDVGRMLQLGRLVREATGSTGFPDAGDVSVIAFPDAADRSRRKAKAAKATAAQEPEPEHDEAAERAAQRELERAARAEAERLAEAARLAEEAEAAEADVERAEQHLAQLEQDLEGARRDLRDARARSKKAAADARRAASRK